MTTKKTKKATPAEPGKDKTLQLEASPEKSRDRLIAELAASSFATNASTLVAYSAGTFGEVSLTDCVMVLKESGKAANDGDLSGAESMLMAQAVALNAMFGELARRAALNMGEYINAADRYMRLALKAQGQCRATLETLAAIKNPPVVIAKQANINNGGQQQVNNGGPTDACASTAKGIGGVQSLEPPTVETTLEPTQRIFSPNENQTMPSVSKPLAVPARK